MHIHNIAFWVIMFFLVGVIGAYYLHLLTILILSLIVSLCLYLIYRSNKNKKFKIFSIISFAIFIGAFYCAVFNLYKQESSKIIFDEKIEYSGIVIDVNKTEKGQNLFVELQNPHKGKIQVYVRQYPVYEYGDKIIFNGIIKKPIEQTTDNFDLKLVGYYLKNGILGNSLFPENKLVSKNNGSQIKSALLKIKNNSIEIFNKGLTYEKAALISGIVIGERGDFSKELKEQMSKSGTTHMVALSGYNISIIAKTAIFFFAFFLSKRKSFYFSIILIILFVIMAGAEASVVRAAIMGFIVLLAKQIGRIHSTRNSIAVAAFLMVISNPNLLLFDVGFQLSFMALIGLIYVVPLLQKFKFFSPELGPGIFGWRENSSQTIAAQIGVFPILLSQFGTFPITSVLANVLILGFMPITMALGFIYAGINFISSVLGRLILFPLDAILGYELSIIKFFGTHYVNIEGKITLVWIFIYYAAIFMVIYYKNIKKLLSERKIFNFEFSILNK